MAAPKCPNPQCEYFNRMLPNTAQVCPMCGTSLSIKGAATAPQPAGGTPQAGGYAPPPAGYAPPGGYSPAPPPPGYAAPQPGGYNPAPQPGGYSPAPVPGVYNPGAATPGSTTRPVVKLVHTTLGREFAMRGEESFIGRRGGTVKPNPEIDLTGIPNDNVISRPHARIYWDPTYATYTIIDENSRNGTFINGSPLTPGVPYQLVNGDLLQLGKSNLVQFTVKIA